MITIFKNFSGYDPKVGDFIIIDLDEMDKHNVMKKFEPYEYPDNIAKINVLNDGTGKLQDYEYFYNIIFYDGKDVNVRREEIVRLATEDEIEEYETKKSARKYNL